MSINPHYWILQSTINNIYSILKMVFSHLDWVTHSESYEWLFCFSQYAWLDSSLEKTQEFLVQLCHNFSDIPPCGLAVVSLLLFKIRIYSITSACTCFYVLFAIWFLKLILVLFPVQLRGGGCLYTCSLRPTGIYGEGHELIRDFYKLGVERGGLIIGGVPDNTEHGRVYAGECRITIMTTTLDTCRGISWT